MEINEFIQQTIQQIVDGVFETNNQLSEKGAYVPSKDIRGDGTTVRKEGDVNKGVINVDFDIAVTVNESNEKGASLSIASVLNVGGKKETKIESQIVNRISFSLPLVLPDDNKPKAKKQGVKVH